jgi:hypothetical protein
MTETPSLFVREQKDLPLITVTDPDNTTRTIVHAEVLYAVEVLNDVILDIESIIRSCKGIPCATLVRSILEKRTANSRLYYLKGLLGKAEKEFREAESKAKRNAKRFEWVKKVRGGIKRKAKL